MGTTRRALMAVFWACAVAPRPSGALTIEPLTPPQVAERSADVVIARVHRVERRAEASGAIVDELRLEVLERWKGPPASELSCWQWVAHERDGVTRTVAGLPLLEDGGTYLLFLPPRCERPLVPLPVGGEAGVFRAQRDGEHWTFFDLGDRPVVGVDARAVYFRVDEPPPQRPRAVSGVGVRPRTAPVAAGARALVEAWRRLVDSGAP